MENRKMKSSGIASLEANYILASFPKSGNTWLRFLVANIYNDMEPRFEEIDFHNVHDICPEIVYPNVPVPFFKQFPYLYKTHDKYKDIFKKVILVLRNPWDTLNSYYWYLNKERGIAISADEIVVHEVYGIKSIIEHANSYVKNCDDLLLITYESLVKNAAKELMKICDFIRVDASDAVIQRAVMRSSFQSMRAIEIKKGRKFGNPKFTFMRSGTIGDGVGQITDAKTNQFIISELKKSPLLYLLYG